MPFAGYKNFADCVKKNSGKKSPQGYCATIMRKIEGQNTNYSKGAIEEAHKKLSK